MIFIDPALTNITENLLHEHFTLPAHIIILHPLVAHIIISLVLVNAPLVTKNSLSDYINHHIVPLLNHEGIAIEVDLTLTQTTTKTYC